MNGSREDQRDQVDASGMEVHGSILLLCIPLSRERVVAPYLLQ